VNQAARLQVKTRELAASILITESTRAALADGDGVALRPRGACRSRDRGAGGGVRVEA